MVFVAGVNERTEFRSKVFMCDHRRSARLIRSVCVCLMLRRDLEREEVVHLFHRNGVMRYQFIRHEDVLPWPLDVDLARKTEAQLVSCEARHKIPSPPVDQALVIGHITQIEWRLENLSDGSLPIRPISKVRSRADQRPPACIR